jgi:hypothetical protein
MRNNVTEASPPGRWLRHRNARLVPEVALAKGAELVVPPDVRYGLRPSTPLMMRKGSIRREPSGADP